MDLLGVLQEPCIVRRDQDVAANPLRDRDVTRSLTHFLDRPACVHSRDITQQSSVPKTFPSDQGNDSIDNLAEMQSGCDHRPIWQFPSAGCDPARQRFGTRDASSGLERMVDRAGYWNAHIWKKPNILLLRTRRESLYIDA